MKKLLLITSFSILIFSSCKKNYTCQCIDEVTGIGTRNFTVEGNDSDDPETQCSEGATPGEHCILSE